MSTTRLWTRTVTWSCEPELKSVSRRVEAVCDHTGERTFSGVDNKSCASSDHFPGRVCWNTGCKSYHTCVGISLCVIALLKVKICLNWCNGPSLSLGPKVWTKLTLDQFFFCFSLWTKWQISDMKIMMIKIDGLITDRVVRYCCQISKFRNTWQDLY